MKRLGLIGGVSPESTVSYYQLLNRAVRDRLGGDHSAPLLISSFDFGEMVDIYYAEDWARYKARVVDAGARLERGGAEALMICSNTTHLAADALKASTDLPVIHLVDALADALKAKNIKRPLLLGTSFVMEQDFYASELSARMDVEVMTPDAGDRKEIDRIIFEELARGQVKPESRQAYVDVIERGAANGADAVIFGCTEIGLLLTQDDVSLPAFNTTVLHAKAGAAFVLSDVAG